MLRKVVFPAIIVSLTMLATSSCVGSEPDVMSMEDGREIAYDFVKNSPTFVFDGNDETLESTNAIEVSIPGTWTYVFRFDSSHAGYGDRTGQILAQVMTAHTVTVTIQKDEVVYACIDDDWDMIRQDMILHEVEPIEVLDIAQLLGDPAYGTRILIQGEVALLGELLCPCFELTSGGQTVDVWYGLMVENDGSEKPDVGIGSISNGDTVIVTGELKGAGGTHYSQGDFWASDITKVVSPPPLGNIEIRLAPIHEVRINIAESFPVQIFVHIQGWLHNGCTTFHNLTIDRNGNDTRIEVTTQEPRDAECTQEERLFEKNVNLGSEFTSGETYTVAVNDVVNSFVMQ